MKEMKYYAGDLIRVDNLPFPYILATPNVDEYCLISTHDGNRWRNPVKIKTTNFLDKILGEKEIKLLIDNEDSTFELHTRGGLYTDLHC